MKFIIFCGLPGTGKSTLAEALGRHFSIPVFAKDWLEGTLLDCEMVPSNQNKPPGYAGYQLLTMLAERQLMLGQSVILDSVASTEPIRNTWKHLSEQYQAGWHVIECFCSDESLHHAQLDRRRRNIPGWHELSWSDVENVRGYYAPWVAERLTLDMVDPVEINLARTIAYCE